MQPRSSGQPVCLAAFAIDDAAILYGLAVGSAAAVKMYQDWYFERGLFAKKAKKSRRILKRILQ